MSVTRKYLRRVPLFASVLGCDTHGSFCTKAVIPKASPDSHVTVSGLDHLGRGLGVCDSFGISAYESRNVHGTSQEAQSFNITSVKY